MKTIDFSKLCNKDLCSESDLIKAFKSYLISELSYDNYEAEIASEDMKNPYDAQYVMMDYEGCVNIDGVDYSIYSCYTDFYSSGMFYYGEVSPFGFYTLFDKSTMPDDTVGSYSNARKMFIL